MDLILTGRSITSQEALQWGVLSRVVPDSDVFNVALESAKLISNYSRPAVLMAKEAANAGGPLFLLSATSTSNNVITCRQPKRCHLAKDFCECAHLSTRAYNSPTPDLTLDLSDASTTRPSVYRISKKAWLPS